MGKRSSFERIPRDFYPTPIEAVIPLIPHLTFKSYIEPCAGDGSLINHIPIECKFACDIEPKRSDIVQLDAIKLDVFDAECIITNPPWDRKILHDLIVKFSDNLPTWLLFDADWMHTKQSTHLIKRCEKIVSVGRVKWIPGSTMVGKDNCSWYLFNNRNNNNTIFIGRNSIG